MTRPLPPVHRNSFRFMVIPCVLLTLAASGTRADDKPKDEPGTYFKIAGAKDAVVDEVRQRLYVTTPDQLKVLDLKTRKLIDSMDLPGGIQGCDISPDSKQIAIAPIKSHFLYALNTDWKQFRDMEVSRIKFEAPSSEPGVFSVCFGKDGLLIFTMTYAGSGGVTLRLYDPETKTVTDVGGVTMDSILTASGDRRLAAIAEGNISNGPVKVFDFETRKMKNVATMNCFHYEMAFSSTGKYFARPHTRGCDLYGETGARLGAFDDVPTMCAAFHPKRDTLFLMRAGETKITEFSIPDQKLVNEYSLEKPLAGMVEVQDRLVTNVTPIGRDHLMANSRLIRTARFRTYESGRMKVSPNGEHLVAVIPSGVYALAVKPATVMAKEDNKPKIKDVETKPIKP